MAPPAELLGICVVYLGGLNYFFSVDEACPVVSKIGTTDAELRVQIAPYIAAGAAGRAPRYQVGGMGNAAIVFHSFGR